MMSYIWFAGLTFFAGLLGVFLRMNVFKLMKFRIFIYFVLAYAVGMIWDYIATTREHWTFAGDALLGVYIGIIPIEDVILMAGLILIAMATITEASNQRK